MMQILEIKSGIAILGLTILEISTCIQCMEEVRERMTNVDIQNILNTTRENLDKLSDELDNVLKGVLEFG